MSKINVNQVDTQCGSTLTLGSSGKTVTLASGASQSGFGRTGTVDWCTTAKTSPFTSVSGKGYFVNTTSGAVTVTLPASPSAGDIVAIKDYANTFDTNNVTIANNGSKICGICANSTLDTESQSVTLIYVDSTKGWQDIHDSTANIQGAQFISATGGNATLTVGDFKTHVFTSDGTFCVSSTGNAAGSNSVEYLVVAGGGGSGAGDDINNHSAGGGGAGGFRIRSTAPGSNSPLNSTSNVPVSAQPYSITVGGGGSEYTNGSNSVFSTITSAGGGVGGIQCLSSPTPERIPGANGGSGGGGGSASGIASTGGSGNTPPVSPPQGNDGGIGKNSGNTSGGGGGGAGAAGEESSVSPEPSQKGGDGGAGSYIADPFVGPTAPSYGTPGPVSSTRFFAGGGGGGAGYPGGTGCGGAGGAGGGGSGGGPLPDPGGDAGTANTGGGAGGSRGGNASVAGGSGIVMIRYKFQ